MHLNNDVESMRSSYDSNFVPPPLQDLTTNINPKLKFQQVFKTPEYKPTYSSKYYINSSSNKSLYNIKLQADRNNQILKRYVEDNEGFNIILIIINCIIS